MASPADAALITGYVLAVPFTLYVPGFQRLWKRREPWVFATAQTGAALITAGWVAKDRPPAAAFNAAWLVGLTVAYVVKGRRLTTEQSAS
jgi:hypothetical protein